MLPNIILIKIFNLFPSRGKFEAKFLNLLPPGGEGKNQVIENMLGNPMLPNITLHFSPYTSLPFSNAELKSFKIEFITLYKLFPCSFLHYIHVKNFFDFNIFPIPHNNISMKSLENVGCQQLIYQIRIHLLPSSSSTSTSTQLKDEIALILINPTPTTHPGQQ